MLLVKCSCHVRKSGISGTVFLHSWTDFKACVWVTNKRKKHNGGGSWSGLSVALGTTQSPVTEGSCNTVLQHKPQKPKSKIHTTAKAQPACRTTENTGVSLPICDPHTEKRGDSSGSEVYSPIQKEGCESTEESVRKGHSRGLQPTGTHNRARRTRRSPPPPHLKLAIWSYSSVKQTGSVPDWFDWRVV